jgi:predicted Zn finger-like uncharacterized protein
MIEIQCTSCHTRYRIDERVLPDETPTFKCSRCGHVFNAEPATARPKKASVRDISSATPRSYRLESSPAAAAPAKDQPEPATPAREAEAEQPEAAKPSTDDLLSRPFSRESEEPDAGENLTFDFNDEGKAALPQDLPEVPVQNDNDDDWQVGEPAADLTPVAISARPSPIEIVRADPPRPAPRADAEDLQFAQPRFARAARESAAERGSTLDRLADDVAYIEPRGTAHSAGWFIAVFFLVAAGFGLASMVICGEPIASARMLSGMPGFGARFARPIVPATLVALHGVRAQYLPIKGGAIALVVSGMAENVGNDPLHDILIAVDLLDSAQRQIAGQASYCGSGLSEKMVGEMTPREIEFLQRLDPQKNFALAAAHSAQFLLVFIDPPRQTATLRISVAKAVAAGMPAAVPSRT